MPVDVAVQEDVVQVRVADGPNQSRNKTQVGSTPCVGECVSVTVIRRLGARARYLHGKLNPHARTPTTDLGEYNARSSGDMVLKYESLGSCSHTAPPRKASGLRTSKAMCNKVGEPARAGWGVGCARRGHAHCKRALPAKRAWSSP